MKTGIATISQILTDKKYDVLHPETGFRNLIEKYAKAETISIASDTIPGKKIKVKGVIKNEDGNPFDDDERLVGNIRQEAIRHRFIIAKPEKADDFFEQKFSYTIILKK